MDQLIKVMIVDDEKLMIEDMTTIINWEKCGFKIVATALNGKQGLKKYKEYHPQLIFSDIRMPFMDGIEMLSEIRKEDPNVHILLLTAFEDFAYAKKAIHFGITEYIMKNEITETYLETLLAQLKSTISIHKKNHFYLQNQLVEQFFTTGSNNPEYNIISGKKYIAMILERDFPINISGEMYLYPKINISINDYIQTNFPDLESEIVINLSNDRFLLLLKYHQQYYQRLDFLKEAAMRLKSGLETITAESFSLYFFDNIYTLEHLKNYIAVFDQFSFKKYLEGSGKINMLNILNDSPFTSLPKTEHFIYNVKELWEKNTPAEFEEYFTNILNNIKKTSQYDYAKRLFTEYYLFLGELNKNLPIEKRLDLSIEKNKMYWLDISKICIWFSNMFEHAIQSRQKKENSYSKFVNETIDFIYKNYSNPDLSLEQIANAVHLSTGYLCVEFKKETGVTLKNFITDIRIDTAKRMLDSGKYKIYEICSKTGYSSSQYFSQAFYKRVGILPTKYKKNEV